MKHFFKVSYKNCIFACKILKPIGMPISPRKFVSNATNLTVNKGVEARETEIANVRLDTEALSSRGATDSGDWAGEQWARCGGAAGAMAAGDAPAPTAPLTPPSTDQSASYVQVVVQKQRRNGSRHPVASSPLHTDQVQSALPIAGLEKGSLPATVLFACPAFTALHQHSMDGARGFCDTRSLAKEHALKQDRDDIKEPLRSHDKNIKKFYFWKRMRRTCEHHADDDYDDGPDCVEVYEFERGFEALVSRHARHVSLVERAARRAARPAAGLLNELLAVPRLAFAATLHVTLQLQRCALLSLREAVTGTVQTTVDVLVKPLLALAFNAVLRPPLVCLAQTAMTMREALRPFSMALTDSVQPLASLLSAVRLVQVESQYTWPCIQHV